MIEQRFLTRAEFVNLINTAPKSETKILSQVTQGIDTYQWLVDRAVDKDGLIIGGRPIYFGVLTKNVLGMFEVWTVVNSNVKEQVTLYKKTKRLLKKWVVKYENIYATMEKINPKNMLWTEKLGFKKIDETDNEVTFLLKKE